MKNDGVKGSVILSKMVRKTGPRELGIMALTSKGYFGSSKYKVVNDCESILEIVKMPKWEELFLLLSLVTGGSIYCLLLFVTTENPSFISCLMDVSLPPASPVIVPSKMLLKVSIIQRTFPREEGKANTRSLRCAAHGQGKWQFWSAVPSTSARSESQGMRREDSGEEPFPR